MNDLIGTNRLSRDVITSKKLKAFLSGIKTADDLVSCMLHDKCEAVPSSGYGYGHGHSSHGDQMLDQKCQNVECSCPKCDDVDLKQSKHVNKTSWLDFSNLIS